MTVAAHVPEQLHHPWTRQRGAECLCCAIMHEAYDDGIAELNRQLDEARDRAMQTSYTVYLLLGRPDRILHKMWLEQKAAEDAVAAEWQRRLDGPRD
jgi:hypothetical protein